MLDWKICKKRPKPSLWKGSLRTLMALVIMMRHTWPLSCFLYLNVLLGRRSPFKQGSQIFYFFSSFFSRTDIFLSDLSETLTRGAPERD